MKISDFLQLVLHRCIRLFWIFSPMVFLSALLLFSHLEMYILFFISFIFTAAQIYIIIKYVVPWVSEYAADVLSGASPDSSADDPTLEAVELLIKSERPDDASKLLERYTAENRKRITAWMTRADLLCVDMGRPAEAVDALKEALHSVRWNKQDKAYFLYRIGKIYDKNLNQPQKALDYWNEASKKYPRTVYGKKSRNKLDSE